MILGRDGGTLKNSRFKMIACKVLYREISLLSATCNNFVDITYLRQGLHDTPALLTQALQTEIDRVDSGDDLYTYKANYYNREFDAILLGYGLCSGGLASLSSKKHTLVIPRAHDCITLFLGSRKKYSEYFSAHSGTFWYNASWIENSPTPSEQTEEIMFEEYKEKFGEENAEYLIQTELTQNYNRCAYIDWDELRFPHHEQYTQNAAEYYSWTYDHVQGSSKLLKSFLSGNWSDEEFLVVPPGKKIVADYEGGILKVEG